LTTRDYFVVGIKLIGAYFLATGLTSLPSLLTVLSLPDSWPGFRALLILALSIALELGVGVYFLRGAPRVMKLAGFDGPPAAS
jgi:hypothetical protein